MKKAFPRFYYGWVIVTVSFFTLFFSMGIRYTFGVFYIAIINEYGWGRAETAGAFSLAMIVHALFSPVSGYLIDRFGPRNLFPIGSILLILGLAAISRTVSIWHLYVFFGIVMAIGINTISYSPHMSIIPRWFIRKRGFSIGLVLSGVGVGTIVLVPFAELMIETIGWRAAFLVLAAPVLFIVLPSTFFFQRRSPEEIGQYPDGIVPKYATDDPQQKLEWHKDDASSNMTRQWTLYESIRTNAFWCIFLVFFCNGFLSNTLLVHQAVHIVDVGYSKLFAASLLGIVGLLSSLGGILGGALSDRIGREKTFMLGSCFNFFGILFLILILGTTSEWMLYIFVFLYGLGYGSIVTAIAAKNGDIFPGSSLGRIIAIQSIGWGIGGALGPYLAGYFHDQMGSYLIPFILLLVCIIVSIIGFWMAAPGRRIDIKTKRL